VAVAMTPAEQLAELMAAARRAGREFFAAWVHAMEGIDWDGLSLRERQAWQQAFTDPAVIAGWHAAYEGFEDARGEACARLDAEFLERNLRGPRPGPPILIGWERSRTSA
jgi:hypothetical protein